MVESPFQSPFDQWAAVQMMADRITSREVSLMRSAWQEAVRQEREAVLAAILDTWRVRGSVDELSARRCWENALLARSEQGGEG